MIAAGSRAARDMGALLFFIMQMRDPAKPPAREGVQPLVSRPGVNRARTVGALLAAAVLLLATMSKGFMPEKRKIQELTPLTPSEAEIRSRIQAHVQMLAATIGGRSADRPEALRAAADYIQTELRSYSYSPERQSFTVHGNEFWNLEAVLPGADPNGIVVIGAHYDTAGGLPGANDNGSGVAAALELARRFSGSKGRHTIRWVFFANEEPPYFQTPGMGSYVYAKRCRERGEDVRAMLSLETIGYYSDEPGSQSYPVGFHPGYPNRGDFLGFVANFRSIGLLRSALKSFRRTSSLPAEGAAAPAGIPGIGWSDHWAFWQFGYKAIMLTDTAPYRYPFYHTARDTPEKLDYDRLARAVTGIAGIVTDLRSR
jgi:Zn-dependent M28 family amino/carboxypeptidase